MSSKSTKSATASATRPQFQCSECGWTTSKWVGRCGECQAWGTVAETDGPSSARTASVVPTLAAAALPIGEVDANLARFRSTGVSEVDRVLGGGIVPGAVMLLAGEPGVGKSTLLLDVAARCAGTGRRVLYVTAEESAAQVRLRADRIDAVHERLLLAAETDLGKVLGQIEATQPELLVVDSVQTLASAQVDGSAGGVAQVREVAASLIGVAKRTNMPVILVGHVTKDGSIAGPRVLEHLVDVVCQFEGDKHAQLRMLRAVKNRYGATDEVGCFVMNESGIHGLADPSGLFISGRRSGVTGSCVTVTLDGRRPLPIEIQALLSHSSTPQPRRATHGVDGSRVAMTLAVLATRSMKPVAGLDVYVSCVGGARAHEPGADLAVALAVASSQDNEPLPEGLVALGEVSLTGELRPVLGTGRRIAEARRLGFTRALVPVGSDLGGAQLAGIRVKEIAHLDDALKYTGLSAGYRGPRRV
ncbi:MULTISPECIES: DNA repair protein RadA [unclassified Pseudactinotalea]|uniref:DNA repair protein RadA n=1 Tax=unclassified Pseudactinotalea TaxID=2649176 RepID=UPI00128AE2DE|nr:MULTISPECIES: DNA repair protein RadA [unclassified Pseudactinotalea]MPV50454.1 DNA repair protein RadA [Pseudactinotalea sp. HY160]QGH70522.1 DNA repair protein RadA [Pseudactinotalea sp. HY158]